MNIDQRSDGFDWLSKQVERSQKVLFEWSTNKSSATRPSSIKTYLMEHILRQTTSLLILAKKKQG